MTSRLLAAAVLAACALGAHAQTKGGSSAGGDAVTIDQAKAEAGSVTPGDAPGFPVTISQPGSYRLASNLTVADVNFGGIEITTPGGVTIDLNGYVIRGARCGPSRCTVNPPWVHGIGGYSNNFSVRDGRVENFGGFGIRADSRVNIERVQVSGNGTGGIVGNAWSRVVDSAALQNVGPGITLIAGIARGNLAAGNTGAQLQASNGAVLVSGNTLLGPLPLDGGGTAGPVSLGDNLCAPAYTSGLRC